MDLSDKLALLARFPGSLKALLDDRMEGPEGDETQLALFIQDVAEDSFAEEDGVLKATDGCSYTIVWTGVKWELVG